MVRCPAVPIAVAMCIAIPPARWLLPILPWLWIAIAIVFVALGVVLRSLGWLASIALIFAAGFTSIAATQIDIYRFASDHIGQFAGDDPRLCRLKLYLPNEPRLRTVSFGARLPFPPKQTTLADVREVLTTDGWTPASGTVLLQVQQPLAQLAAGQTIEAVGLLERPGIAMNPGQFDWQRYYREQGVLVDVQVRRAENITILDRSPASMLTRMREEIRSLLAAGFGPERSLDHALIAALVLGDYDPELRDVKDQFRKTGTSHHLAISGMHIAVVGGMVFLLLRLIGVGPRGCWIGALIVIGFYACVAMPSPPVMRAVILFTVAGVAFISARFTSVIQLLALTVAIMMAWSPIDLFNAGFQLSFGTVLGLILLSEPLARRWSRDDDVIFLPAEVEQFSSRQKFVLWIDRQWMRTVATGVLAWVISMPLVAEHFTQLNLWQVPASIALAPIVTVSLLLGVLKIVGTAIFPSAASFLATCTADSSALMRWLVGWLAKLPYGDVPLSPPPLWLVAACWITLAFWVVRWRLASVRIGTLVLLIATFAYMLIGPFWFGSATTLAAGQMRVTLMSVGAGQCCLVETGGGRTVMIDCGSDSLTDLTSNVIVPVMREYGQTKLDSIFISHANTDHYSSVADAVNLYDAREVVVAAPFEASALETPSGGATLKALRDLDVPPRIAHPGDRIPLSKDSYIEILWPPEDTGKLDANETCLVLRLHKGDHSILFTGDIQTEGMKGLMASNTLHADILVAPHHGSSEDITPAFVDAVSPSWIVASDDHTPSGKQKRFDAMMAGRHVLRTHEYGAITILFGPDGAMKVDGFAKRVGE